MHLTVTGNRSERRSSAPVSAHALTENRYRLAATASAGGMRPRGHMHLTETGRGLQRQRAPKSYGWFINLVLTPETATHVGHESVGLGISGITESGPIGTRPLASHREPLWKVSASGAWPPMVM